jgi:hypothetical protein
MIAGVLACGSTSQLLSPARLGFVWDERACLLRASRLDFSGKVVNRRCKETKMFNSAPGVHR